jgi:hypothetical protein
LRFNVKDADGTSERPGIAQTDLSIGEWLHIAGVYDGNTHTAKIYLNGVLKDNHNNNAGLTGNVLTGQLAAFGRNGSSSDYYFSGIIDEARIWNSARTQTEIRGNMHKTLNGDETNLMAYFRFDHISGTALDDLTTNDNYGTLNNMGDEDWVSAGWCYGCPYTITADVTDITSTTATCGGEVTDEGSSFVTAKGIVWDTLENPTVETNIGITNDGSGLGSFTSSLTGLTSDQTYYVRAYAINSEDTAYAEQKVFASDMNPPGNALDFDGIDDYVHIPNSTSLNIDTNKVTLEMWVKLTTLPGNISEDFESIYGSTQNSYIFYLDKSNLELSFKVKDSDGTAESPGIAQADLTTGEWLHIAGIYDGTTGTAKIYLNGVLKDIHTNAELTGNVESGQNASFGRNGNQDQYYFNGSIDEARIWNVARSLAEIRENMHRTLNGDEDNLVAYYRFDHISGTTLSDRTSNDNDGTLHNMDDTDWVSSTAPIPYFTVTNGNWESNSTWATGQNAPIYQWSRVKIKNNVALNSNIEVIELKIENSAILTISTGNTLTVGVE